MQSLRSSAVRAFGSVAKGHGAHDIKNPTADVTISIVIGEFPLYAGFEFCFTSLSLKLPFLSICSLFRIPPRFPLFQFCICIYFASLSVFFGLHFVGCSFLLHALFLSHRTAVVVLLSH